MRSPAAWSLPLMAACTVSPVSFAETGATARPSLEVLPGQSQERVAVDQTPLRGVTEQAPWGARTTGRQLVSWQGTADELQWRRKHPAVRILGTVTLRRTWALVEGLTLGGPDTMEERRRERPRSVRGVAALSPLDRLQWSWGPRFMDVTGAHNIWQTLPGRLGRPPVVAIIDTGTETSHPDLDVLRNLDAVHSLLDEGDIRDTVADPNEDHGTACAGLAGARDDGLGMSGMSPGAKILGLRVTDEEGTITDFSILQALRLAADFGQPEATHPLLRDEGHGPVRVVSMSLGGYDARILPAYEEAFSLLRERGIPAFVAAGNEAWTDRIAAPANQRGALAVGCTMRYLDTEWLAPYSNAGPGLHVTAGGNMVYAPVSRSLRGVDWALFNGTSAATPLVAGLAALVTWANDDLSSTMSPESWCDLLAAHLARTAEDLGTPGWDPGYGHGRIHTRRALETPLDPR
ncbi:MAG: S8 family peptidase [Candidatus Sericytochromatia bacterium]|nr:S8 family peptidase [Candidatus Sericytochromatia bacterium]